MHVTAHMLLEAYRQTQREILELDVSATEKAKRHRTRWERMAQLLNEKLADHTAYVEPDDEEPSLSSQSNERSTKLLSREEALTNRLSALGYIRVVLDHNEVYVEDENRLVRIGFIGEVETMTDAAIIYEVEAELTSQEENEADGWA